MAFNRQNSFDYIVERYQELIAKFDDMVKKQDEFKKFVNSASENLLSLQKNHQNLSKEMQDSETRVNQTISIVNQNSNAHAVPINELKASHERLQKRLDAANTNMGLHSNLISELKEDQKSFAKSDKFENLKKDHELALNEHRKAIENHQVKITGLFHDNANLIREFSVKDKQLASVSAMVQAHSESLSEISSSFKNQQGKVSQEFADLQASLKDHVAQQISAIPKPVIPSLDDIKKQTDKQLESVILDARNSNIRSANNESKVSILEKKVEQLQLLLKQYELQK